MTFTHFLALLCFLRTHALPTDQRIIGGQPIPIEQIPFQVALELEPHGQICGGAILDVTTVLTAAHCTHPSPGGVFNVRAGSSQRGSGGQLVRVARVIEHPQYVPETHPKFDNDICILKLQSPLQFGGGVAAAQLVLPGGQPPAGSFVVASGWGRTNIEEHSQELLKADLKVVDWNSCREVSQGLTNNMVCVGSDGADKGICMGDSGGPLSYNGNVVIGVASFVFTKHCDPRYPGVYTSVEKYHSWIKQNMQ